MNTPILETSRLILRKFTERDMEALFLILKDEEANKFLPWYPVKDLEETRRFYQERYAAKYGQPQAYAYAICLKTEDFSKPKIVWKIIGNQMAFAYDANNYVMNNACYIMTGDHLDYLLAVLNFPITEVTFV